MQQIEFAEVIHNPGSEYSEETRYWQGCPTILRTSGGILYAGFFTGGTVEPSPHNYNVLQCSRDNGNSWVTLLVIAGNPKKKLRALDIQLWLDPQKRMWVFWTQRNDRFIDKHHEHLSVCAIICDDPDAEELQWSMPRYVSPGYLRTQPTVLSDGRVLLFTYDWISDCYTFSESTDGGESYQQQYGGRKVATPFDEAMAVERCDGSIWMLARSNGGALAESVSCDGGKSWSDGLLTDLRSPSTRFFLQRLRSGRLLLIKNDSIAPRRDHLTAYLSEDDGLSWPWKMIIDVEDVSYPDAVEDSNGAIYIIYDYGRHSAKEILMACITEEDIMAGTLCTETSFLKRKVSKAPQFPVSMEMYRKQLEVDRRWLVNYLKRNDLPAVLCDQVLGVCKERYENL